MTGASGSYSASTATSAWSKSVAFNGAVCAVVDGDPTSSLNLPTGNKHLIAIDLGAGTTLNGSLTVDTCTNPFMDTVLAVSGGATGCPVTAASWKCANSDDDGCARQSTVTIVAAWRWVFAIVGGYGGVAAPYTLTWTYAPPTASPSSRWSSSATRTASATSARSVGASASGTPTPTVSAPLTRTQTGTGTVTPSNSPTPTVTASQSGSAGLCAASVYVTSFGFGASGAVSGTLAGQGSLFPYGHCANMRADGTYDGTLAVLEPAAQVLVVITLADDAPPANGTLVLDTCTRTEFDTMLWVGTSCPTGKDFSNMDCIASNDDACSLQSVITVPTDGVTASTTCS